MNRYPFKADVFGLTTEIQDGSEITKQFIVYNNIPCNFRVNRKNKISDTETAQKTDIQSYECVLPIQYPNIKSGYYINVKTPNRTIKCIIDTVDIFEYGLTVDNVYMNIRTLGALQ